MNITLAKPALAACAAALCALAAPSAHALFKVIGPDGRVTYTDRPPPASEGRVLPVNRETGVASDPQLPFALHQVAMRIPVVLYTTAECGDGSPMARALLARRGIPYSERTATSQEEREAWARIVGGSETPTLLVGSQSLRGFTPSAWDETLDVAGYPRSSQLPVTYQPPAPTPLIPPRADTPAPRTPPTTPRAPANEGGANPSGIRF